MTQTINPVRLRYLCIYLLSCILNLTISNASVTPPTVYPNNIMDLYGGSLDLLTALAQPWSFNGQTNPAFAKAYLCNSQQFLGFPTGFSSASDYMEREYTGLSSHDILYYSIRVYAFEGWQSTDTIKITLDSTDVATWTPYNTISQEGQAYCGTGNNDAGIFFSGKFMHTGSNLKIRVTSYITSGSTTAAFAMRGVRISLGHKTAADVQGVCFKFTQRTTTTNCYCEQFYFESPPSSTNCVACFTGCNNCFGSAYTDGYGCKNGYSYDGTGCVQCTANCQLCTGPNSNQCLYCASSYILYWDGTCQLTTCSTPYVLQTVGDLQMCQTPCQPTNGYFYSNQQCYSTCDAPFLIRIEGQGLFCDYPCNTGAGQFWSWDGSCTTTCNGYLRTENGYTYCDACQPGYFKYPNGTCLPICDSPRTDKVVVQSHFCQSPCADSSQYYFPSSGQCKSDCEYPYVVSDLFFCVYNIPADELGSLNTISEAMSTVGKIIGPVTALAGLLSAGNPGAFNLATLSDMLHYIRYMKILYPPKMQYILDQDSPQFLSVIPQMTDGMMGRFPDYSLPAKFEQYGYYSSFIVNFWNSMISLLMYVVAGVTISSLLEAATKNCKLINSIFRKLRKTLKWNYSIMLMISYYQDIVMASSLELRTVQFGSVYETLSFVTCIIINIIGIFVFLKMISVALDLGKNRTKNNEKNKIHAHHLVKKRLRDYKIVFEECKEGSFLQRAFMCIFVLKLYLFYVIIAYLFDHPLVQTILLTSLSFIYVLYLLLSRPFKSKFALAENLIQEVILLIVNICALALSILDLLAGDMDSTRLTFGQIFVMCDTAFGSLTLLFILFHLFGSLKHIYVKIKTFLQNRKKPVPKTNKSNVLSTIVPYPSSPPQRISPSIPPSKLPASKIPRDRASYPYPSSSRDYASSSTFQPLRSSQSPELVPLDISGSRYLNDSTIFRSRLDISNDFGTLDNYNFKMKNRTPQHGSMINSARSNSKIQKKIGESQMLSFETKTDTRRHLDLMRSLGQEDLSFQEEVNSPPVLGLALQPNIYKATRIKHSSQNKRRKV